MSSPVVLLVVSWIAFLHVDRTSQCDQQCADRPVFSPSVLVVKYGDPTSARCDVCQNACIGTLFDLEKSVGRSTTNGTTITWTVDRLTEWDASALCFYNDRDVPGHQCCSTLPVTTYQPPEAVSLSLVNHTGPMLEGRQYTLQCRVQEVAPAESLVVTFYRGRTPLRRLQSNGRQKSPVNETFSLNINASREDDGVQYWCDATLELGPDGPQLPPVVKSEHLLADVFYKPRLKTSAHLHPITVTEGDTLLLDCMAEGNPTPSYTWMSPSGGRALHGGARLSVEAVTPADVGRYVCMVSNREGAVSAEFTATVRDLTTSTRSLPTTTTTTTTAATTTTTTTTTAATTTTTATTTPSSSAGVMRLHRFILCFMLFLSALI